LAAPLAIGYAAHHAIFFVDRAMASTSGTGSVAALNYGYRLALVVGQLGGLAVATAVFPTMAEQAARKDYAGLRASLAGALRLVLTIGLPACVALIVLREPIVKVVFERGAFGPSATATVSNIVRWYAVAVLADALSQPLWRVVFVWRRASTVLAVSGLQSGSVLSNLMLIRRVYGLALSAAIGLGCSHRTGLAGTKAARSVPEQGWWLSALRIVVAVPVASGDGLAALGVSSRSGTGHPAA
jgi:putative peptidoglycan lipid II flippase